MPKMREKISVCPLKIKWILDQANYLPNPLPVDFPNEYENLKSPEEIQKRINYLAEILPDSFIQSSRLTRSAFAYKVLFTARNAEEPLDVINFFPLHSIYSAIDITIRCKKALERIVEWNKESSDSRRLELKKDDIQYIGFEMKDGVMNVRVEFPFADLINEKIDTRRIKQCGECKNFSWAKRLNKDVENELCESCSNKLRQKRFIEKNKEEIKLEKRKKYYNENSIPFCEKCIRPNTKCDCYLNERSKK
jgi:hypothetical protein